jgi:hypothetical protein
MRKRLGFAAVVCATAVLAATAGTAAAPAASTESGPGAGNVRVSFKINKFVAQGKQLVANGAAIATYTAASGETTTTSEPMQATVKLAKGLRRVQQSAKICNVLELDLKKLSLVLLGLHIDLDEVHLTITADSEGGVLGSLFCSLANSKVKLTQPKKLARKLNTAIRGTPVNKGVGFAVPLQSQTAAADAATCQILDLVLGPLDLNLLGLMVHLDQVHLSITADPNGGILGSLLCSLAGGKVPTVP